MLTSKSFLTYLNSGMMNDHMILQVITISSGPFFLFLLDNYLWEIGLGTAQKGNNYNYNSCPEHHLLSTIGWSSPVSSMNLRIILFSVQGKDHLEFLLKLYSMCYLITESIYICKILSLPICSWIYL